ncbi:MAG: type II and III secretion system protein [Candidatus Cloacimonadota bacterium]|nr:type II and III secretion system protein [Candidatus Cloacimonadota bacterium]
MKKLINFLILLCFVLTLFGQEQNIKTIPEEELITISRETNFAAAIKAIEYLSLDFAGKNILNTSNFNNPIGIPIKGLQWKDALNLIIRFHNLTLEERPATFVIKDIEVIIDESGQEIGVEGKVTASTKQVRISAIFFKADKMLIHEVGIDWTTLIGGEVDATVSLNTTSNLSSDILSASLQRNLQTGNVTIDLNTLLKIIEANQRGTIIARPSITVVSKKKGFIQVGQDFSVKTLDQAGNTTEKFFETGIIMEVTPEVLVEDDREAIYLSVEVEKSSALPGDITTIIDKSKSITEVLLFDGEETVIGGLFDKEIKTDRGGIPILKDLPWWFFGLKYLFGYETKSMTTREMIVVLKAEIIDNIDDRKLLTKPTEEKIEQERKDRKRSEKLFMKE